MVVPLMEIAAPMIGSLLLESTILPFSVLCPKLIMVTHQQINNTIGFFMIDLYGLISAESRIRTLNDRKVMLKLTLILYLGKKSVYGIQ